MMPKEKIAKLLKAPPVNAEKSPATALLPAGPAPPSTSGLIPGSGTYAPSLYRARIMAVNRSLWRSSGTFQALARDPNMLALQYLYASAARLYLALRRLGEGVGPHRYGPPDLAVAEDFDELRLLPDEPGGPQLVRPYRITGYPFEVREVDGRVVDRTGDGVPAPCLALEARQAALQRHLAALVGGVGRRARAGAGALVAAAAGLALPRADPAPDALAPARRTWGRRDVVEPHYSWTSSTWTKWRTLWSMPLIWGVSPCTRESLIRLRPRALTVRFWSPFEPIMLFICVTLRGLIA